MTRGTADLVVTGNGVALWRGQLTGWRLSQLRMTLLFVAILLIVASLASIHL